MWSLDEWAWDERDRLDTEHHFCWWPDGPERLAEVRYFVERDHAELVVREAEHIASMPSVFDEYLEPEVREKRHPAKQGQAVHSPGRPRTMEALWAEQAPVSMATAYRALREAVSRPEVKELGVWRVTMSILAEGRIGHAWRRDELARLVAGGKSVVAARRYLERSQRKRIQPTL